MDHRMRYLCENMHFMRKWQPTFHQIANLFSHPYYFKCKQRLEEEEWRMKKITNHPMSRITSLGEVDFIITRRSKVKVINFSKELLLPILNSILPAFRSFFLQPEAFTLHYIVLLSLYFSKHCVPSILFDPSLL